jgi:DNA replication protein DnaD
MSQGWFSIHRQIASHWLWNDKPFSKGQAWIDILLMVNHEDRKVPLGNEIILVKRGSKITSIRKLCDRWGWSNTKVKAFLKLLENDKMLVQKSDTTKTVLTVCNYNDYQDNKSEKTSEKRQTNVTKTSEKHTNNNVNNSNNENNSYIPKKSKKEMTIQKTKRYTEEELEAKLLNKEAKA